MPPFDWWPMTWFPVFPILLMVLGLAFCFFMMSRMVGHYGPWHRWRDDTPFPNRRALDILNERSELHNIRWRTRRRRRRHRPGGRRP